MTASLPQPLRTVVLADNHSETLVNDQGFSLSEIIAWIMRSDSTMLTWEIDSQVNVWFQGLDRDRRIDLFSGTEVCWGQFRLTYVTGKFLEVRRLRKLWRLCDASGFWTDGEDFETVLLAWKIPTQSRLFDAAIRSEWRAYTVERIAGASQARCDDLYRLMCRVSDAMDTHDLKPARMHGTGSIASRLIKEARDDHWIARYRPDRQPLVGGAELLPIFQAAYYGGRQETTVCGSWDVPSYDYDLRSAYPWALSWLGPVGFCWDVRTVFSAALADRMSVWYVSWDVRPSWLGPFPYREREGAGVTYPQTGRGWYWWPEVDAAIRAYGDGAIRVVAGYVSPGSADRPLLPMIKRRYAQRGELERAGHPLAAILKRGMAALYGKLAQAEAARGLPGRWYNPALAGWVTSAIRGRLIDAWQGQEGLICAISTDGLLTTQPLRHVRRSARLGGWKAKRWDRSELVLPGMYRLTRYRADDAIAAQVTASSGVHALDFDWLLSRLNGTTLATVAQRWFVPSLLADLWPDRWEGDRCRWLTGSTAINPWRMAKKRQTTSDLLSLQWQTEYLAFPPYESRGDHASIAAPLPPAWRADRPTLIDLAIGRILPGVLT